MQLGVRLQHVLLRIFGPLFPQGLRPFLQCSFGVGSIIDRLEYVLGGGGVNGLCRAVPCRAAYKGRGVNGLCRAVPKCTYQIKATHGSE